MGDELGSLDVDPVTGAETVSVRLDLLDRKPATIDPISALVDLHEKLAACTERFRVSDDNGREATWRAVAFVTDYLTGVGIPFEALLPLTNAGIAAAEAGDGISNPTFEVKRSGGGRPPKRADVQVSDGVLAAVTELCVRHEQKTGSRRYLDPGLKRAAEMLKAYWRIKIEARRLKEIRETIGERGAFDKIPFTEILSSPLATSHPLEYVTALLLRDRAALHVVSD